MKRFSLLLIVAFFMSAMSLLALDLTVQLKNSQGVGLSNGSVAYYHSGGWRTAGLNGTLTNANGVLTGTIPDGVTTVSISYLNTSVQGTIGSGGTVLFTTVKAGVELQNSTGTPIAGATSSYYANGGWRTIGTTGADGKASIEILPGNYNLSISYLNTNETTASPVNFSASYTHLFQTIVAEVELQTSTGAPIAGATSSYYSNGGWRTIGTTGANGKASIEILRGNYNLSISYLNTNETTASPANFLTSSTHLFKTIVAEVELQNSLGAPIAGASSSYYSNGGWRTIGTTGADGKASIEILRGNYKLSMSYNNTSETTATAIDFTTSYSYLFTTTKAIVKLADHEGNLSLIGGSASYYSNGGWRAMIQEAQGVFYQEILSMGSTAVPFEFNFSIGYQYMSNTKVFKINDGEEHIFNTVPVSMQLKSSTGSDLIGSMSFYAAGGWRTYTNINATDKKYMELLPGNYTAQVGYLYVSQQLRDVVIVSLEDCEDIQTIVFKTRYFKNGATSYYASGGWRSCVAPYELLPGDYTFKFADNTTKLIPIPKYAEIENQSFCNNGIQGVGADNHKWAIVSFVDSKGNPVSGKEIKFRFDGVNTYYSLGQTNQYGYVVYDINQEGNLFNGAGENINPAGYVPTANYYNKNKLHFQVVHMLATKTITMNDITVENYIVFQTVEAKLKAEFSTGEPIQGVVMSYVIANVGGGALNPTNENGISTVELFAGNYGFTARYAYSNSSVSTTVAAVNDIDHTFKTAKAILKATFSDGSPLVGIPISYTVPNSGGNAVGNTDADGLASVELFPGTYSYSARYAYTSSSVSTVLNSGNSNTVIHTFQTVKATIKVAECTEEAPPIAGIQVSYVVPNSGGGAIGTTDAEGLAEKELFAGTYPFTASTNRTSVTAQVNITSGDPIDYTFSPTKLNFNNWNGRIVYTITNSGSCTVLDGSYIFPGTYNFNYYEGNVIKKTVATTIPSGTCEYFTTYAVRLIKNGEEPLAGGVVKYKDATVGTTNANGYVNIFVVDPANFEFTMTYNGGAQTLEMDLESNKLVFEAYPVSYTNPNTIQYYQLGTSAPYLTFTQPTMYLLEGDYKFKFGEEREIDVRVSGTASQSIEGEGLNYGGANFIVNLEESDEDPIDGGLVKIYFNGKWEEAGTTIDGLVTGSLPENVGNALFRIYYKGAYIEKWQNVKTNSYITFATKAVTFKLLASNGAELTPTDRKFYTSTWQDFGAETISLELLPVNTLFRVYYKGAYLEKWQNISGNADVVFAAKSVTFKLLASDGEVLTASDRKFYTSSWQDFGAETTTLELLPANTLFRVYYKGAYLEKWQNISTNADVVFATKAVTFKLLASDGTTEITPDNRKFYTSIWQDFGAETTTLELLPVNSLFRVYYKGAYLEKWQNINTNADLVFATKAVSFKLLASDGANLTPDQRKFYTSSWQDFGTETTTLQLLPVNTLFRLYYKGAYLEKWQNLNTNADVVFSTKAVTFKLLASGGTDLTPDLKKFYTSTWQDFGAETTLQLLPVNTLFRVYYKGAYLEKWQNVNTNADVVFSTKAVIFKLLASDNSEIIPDNRKFYTSTWQDFGAETTALELLPVNTLFRVYYKGAYQEKWQNVNTSGTVTFQTVNAIVKLIVSSVETSGATAIFYTSSWQSFGTGFTTTNMELLPVNTLFRVALNGVKQEKWHTLSVINNTVVFTRTSKDAMTEDVVDVFTIDEIYPNPASENVTINYQVSNESAVNIAIYDIAGNIVRILESGMASVGKHTVNWNTLNNSGMPVANGTYYIIIENGENRAAKSIIISK